MTPKSCWGYSDRRLPSVVRSNAYTVASAAYKASRIFNVVCLVARQEGILTPDVQLEVSFDLSSCILRHALVPSCVTKISAGYFQATSIWQNADVADLIWNQLVSVLEPNDLGRWYTIGGTVDDNWVVDDDREVEV